MIRDDLLWAINLTLLPLSMLAAYYSLTFQRHMAKKGYEDQPEGMVTVVRCLTVLTCGIAISSSLWMAWDLGIFSLIEQQNLSIIMRCFFLWGVILFCTFFNAASQSTLKYWFPVIVVVYFIMAYGYMVLT